MKLKYNEFSYRVFTKPIMLILLFFFYVFNNNEKSKNRKFYVICALFFLLVGEMFVAYKGYLAFMSYSLLCFTLSKLFYIFRFSIQNDFKMTRLLPVLSFCFVYIVVLFNLIYENLGNFMIPVLLFLFLTMIIIQFVFLRKSEVDYQSYLLVGFGILFSVIAETLAILEIFYSKKFLEESIILLVLYSVSHYLVILGLVTEKIQVNSEPIQAD